jgi:hypothetical protein
MKNNRFKFSEICLMFIHFPYISFTKYIKKARLENDVFFLIIVFNILFIVNRGNNCRWTTISIVIFIIIVVLISIVIRICIRLIISYRITSSKSITNFIIIKFFPIMNIWTKTSCTCITEEWK